MSRHQNQISMSIFGEDIGENRISVISTAAILNFGCKKNLLNDDRGASRGFGFCMVCLTRITNKTLYVRLNAPRQKIPIISPDYRAVAWPKYTGGGGAVIMRVPVPDVNSGVNVGDPGPNVCPYPIEMYMLGFPIH